MNEEQWLASDDPNEMVRYLLGLPVGERKVRLLACACCRLVWPLLPDPRSRHAVEVTERYADGRATHKELARARNAALAVISQTQHVPWAAFWATNVKASGPIDNVLNAAAAAVAQQAVRDHGAAWDASYSAGRRAQVALIRDVFDNPFRPHFLDPAWLAWGGGVVRQLAEGIYEERAFDRLPVLGDALEEAGCADRDVLEHCRGSGDHVRGCWIVDLALGRN